MGNITDFGNLLSSKNRTASCSDQVRGINGGGNPNTNVIEYLTIAQTGNAVDFGNLTRKKYASYGGISSRTRGILPGGYYYNEPGGPGTYTDEMDAITISIQSNAFDFGDLVQGNRAEPGSAANETRGIIFGGRSGPSPLVYTNTITYVQIATLGGGIDFGDMSAGYQNPTGTASQTRLVMGTGEAPSGNYNSLEYITISTLGNAADFGDISDARREAMGSSNAVRGLIAGGGDTSGGGGVNTIEFVTIATLGNSKDFGDLTYTSNRDGASGASATRGIVGAGGDPFASPYAKTDIIVETPNGPDAQKKDIAWIRRRLKK